MRTITLTKPAEIHIWTTLSISDVVLSLEWEYDVLQARVERIGGHGVYLER